MTSTATTVPADTAVVVSWLRTQHTRVLGIVHGLGDQQLRRAVMPSGWSVFAMVNHLTEATCFWLREIMRDEHPEAPVVDDFAVDELSATQILADFRTRCSASLAGIESLPLSTPPAWWPVDTWSQWRLHSLHDVLLHLLIETACHAGHLDAARELIDGGTWDYGSERVTTTR